MTARLPATLAVLLLAACFAVAPTAARSDDDPRADPLEPLRAATSEQDRLLEQGKGQAAVEAARERVKNEGSAESHYLLGRALGNVAVKRAETQMREREAAAPRDPNGPPSELVLDRESNRLLDDANVEFDKSREEGGLLFAPAHLGLARVARCRGNLDLAVDELQKALRISKNFKGAALELAQVWRERRNPGEAEIALYGFLEVRPDDADARIMLGILKLSRRRFAEAEPEFRAVLSKDAENQAARKLLADVLMFQEKYDESAEHFEMVRRARPKDDEAYVKLFYVYRRLKKKDEAVGVLNEIVKQMPGTEAARRANDYLKKLAEDPTSWDAPDDNPQESLVQRLKSPDQSVVQRALEDMRAYRWPVLPATVYRLLVNETGTPAQRLAAVRLIGDLADPQTLTVLEILLAHPKEQERDATVRKEVAHAISVLPTDAVVLILFEALGDADPDVREWAVQGIAARTGKWFRADLAVRTPDDAWPAELALYRRWWSSMSASAAKRNATTAMSSIYQPVLHESKLRVARYALPAMEDGIEGTWRAGYDLFRALTYRTFGSEQGHVEEEERARITREAREWLEKPK